MPLDKSGSKASVGNNIKIERAAGKPEKQAIAIALDVQRRNKASGGSIKIPPRNDEFAPKIGSIGQLPAPGKDDMEITTDRLRQNDQLQKAIDKNVGQDLARGGGVAGLASNNGHGPLHSAVPGRTDHLPIDVRAESHVIPADIVSSLGEGNTNAGMKVMAHLFPRSMHPDYAKGGNVPINAAGGEFVVVPEDVAHHGGGDLKRGHDVLDAFIRHTRSATIKTLRKLPGPSK